LLQAIAVFWMPIKIGSGFECVAAYAAFHGVTSKWDFEDGEADSNAAGSRRAGCWCGFDDKGAAGHRTRRGRLSGHGWRRRGLALAAAALAGAGIDGKADIPQRLFKTGENDCDFCVCDHCFGPDDAAEVPRYAPGFAGARRETVQSSTISDMRLSRLPS
jgi:hypothetical protein